MGKRELKKVDVSFISLVTKGANQKVIIWKSDSKDNATYNRTVEIIKTDVEQKMVYGVVYSPDEVDSQGHFAKAETIREMAYSFLKNLRIKKIDEQHDFQADEGYVAESWLIRKNDELFPNEKPGSWAVGIKVENESTWAKIQKGEITGLSMAGVALVEDTEDKGISGIPEGEPNGSGIIQKFRKWFGIEKDFNSNLKQRQFRDLVYALESTLDEILRDETITDKKTAIMESISQFSEAISGMEIVVKAGKVFSQKNLNRIKNAVKELIDALSEAESVGNEGISTTNKTSGDEEMTNEEITNIVRTAVEEAVKPLDEKITALENDKVEFQKSLNERVETMEKASPGSRQHGQNGKDGQEAKEGIFV